MTLTCRPVQNPHPPIWFAANNDAAVRRAARLGDTWFVNPHATMATITRQMALYREELAHAWASRCRACARSSKRSTARGPADGAGAGRALSRREVPAYASWGQDAVHAGDTFRQPFEELLRDRFVLGSPEECYEQLRPCWEAAGANFLFFRTHWLGMPLAHALASMRLMSDELLPALRQVATAVATAG